MAGRRMFSRTITGSGAFLDLSGDAQALYFLLGMEADDDGFVEGKVVLRLAQKKEEDLRLLEREGYVKVFGPQLITYIVDWTVNNQIRRDRYSQSRYAGLLEEPPVQAPEKQPEEAEAQKEKAPEKAQAEAPKETRAEAGEAAPKAAAPGDGEPAQRPSMSRKKAGRGSREGAAKQPPRSASLPGTGGYCIDPGRLAEGVPRASGWHIGL